MNGKAPDVADANMSHVGVASSPDAMPEDASNARTSVGSASGGKQQQEATAIVIDKACNMLSKDKEAKTAKIMKDAKLHLKERAKHFLKSLLNRPQLAESMDPGHVKMAVDQWLPSPLEKGDVGSGMRYLLLYLVQQCR